MVVQHLEILVEEPSMEQFLHVILPKLLDKSITFSIHVFQGKLDLLRKLEHRLKGYRHFVKDQWKIIVLIDEDREDCFKLKQKLENASTAAGLFTKSKPRSDDLYQVINRIAIEELEAWYFGDISALCKAYPKIPRTLGKKAKYRDPDAITGGTWEQLERVLNRARYHEGGFLKIQAAKEIAVYMDPSNNRSTSFQKFRDAIFEICTA